jgi:hypothetical protein
MRDNTVHILLEPLPVKDFVVFTLFHIDWNDAFSSSISSGKEIPEIATEPHIQGSIM